VRRAQASRITYQVDRGEREEWEGIGSVPMRPYTPLSESIHFCLRLEKLENRSCCNHRNVDPSLSARRAKSAARAITGTVLGSIRNTSETELKGCPCNSIRNLANTQCIEFLLKYATAVLIYTVMNVCQSNYVTMLHSRLLSDQSHALCGTGLH